MPVPRIPPVEPPYLPEVADDLEKMMPPGFDPLKLFRTLAHNPRILHKFRLSNLLDRGAIDSRQREIVILRREGRPIRHIAQILSMSKSSVERALTRIHERWPHIETDPSGGGERRPVYSVDPRQLDKLSVQR